jgi:hypothetical protein
MIQGACIDLFMREATNVKVVYGVAQGLAERVRAEVRKRKKGCLLRSSPASPIASRGCFFSSRATYWTMHYARGIQKPSFSILLNPVGGLSHHCVLFLRSCLLTVVVQQRHIAALRPMTRGARHQGASSHKKLLYSPATCQPQGHAYRSYVVTLEFRTLSLPPLISTPLGE